MAEVPLGTVKELQEITTQTMLNHSKLQEKKE